LTGPTDPAIFDAAARAPLTVLPETCMDQRRIEELRAQLEQLLQKQAEFLNSEVFGGASDTEFLEYELRQDMIHDIYEELARQNAA
jgi:hypothetical protein